MLSTAVGLISGTILILKIIIPTLIRSMITSMLHTNIPTVHYTYIVLLKIVVKSNDWTLRNFRAGE